MGLICEPRGVAVVSEGNEELLLSREGVSDLDSFIPWSLIQALRVLPPHGGRILGRVAAVAFAVALGNVWTGGLPRVGCRLQIEQSSGAVDITLHLSRADRRELETLIAWVNEHLADQSDLSRLNSARPFWR